ncbi:MAG: hypothetical protein Q9186_004928 [Xanthomendoza sp. 1 TL-2023]
MHIRRAVNSDCPTTAAFSVAAFSKDYLYQCTHPYAVQNPTRFRNYFLRRQKLRNLLPGFITWVAIIDEEDDQGEAGLRGVHEAVVKEGTNTVLERVQVDPEYQRCGIGIELISWGLSQAAEEKVPVTLTTSPVAEPLYPDTCCFNAPGGLLLQTQFWDTNPPTGPSNSWTVHGLWPDNCDGTYEQYCDQSRQYTNITAIISAAGQTDLLNYMNTYWKDYQGNDESFWEHEWGKHGTCISTLEPGCYDNYTPQQEVVAYFQKTVDLFKTLDSYAILSAAGIVPSSTKTYTSTQILAALAAPRGVQVSIMCRNGEIDEIWYFYEVRGSVQTGTFVPAEPDGSKSNCPASGIKYLPKTGTPPSTSTGSPPTSTPTPGNPFSGKGTLPVTSGGKTNGCIISGGTWYTTGTCASFTAAASGKLATLNEANFADSIRLWIYPHLEQGKMRGQ